MVGDLRGLLPLLTHRSFECILAEREDQIAGLCIRGVMFFHGTFSFNSLPGHDAVLKVMAEEERKVFKVHQVVQLLQREGI